MANISHSLIHLSSCEIILNFRSIHKVLNTKISLINYYFHISYFSGANEVANISQTVILPDGSELQMFDPSHQYAFTPPRYDSLPKEPPKYADIVRAQQVEMNEINHLPNIARENAAYQEEQVPSDEPPLYSLECSVAMGTNLNANSNSVL